METLSLSPWGKIEFGNCCSQDYYCCNDDHDNSYEGKRLTGTDTLFRSLVPSCQGRKRDSTQADVVLHRQLRVLYLDLLQAARRRRHWAQLAWAFKTPKSTRSNTLPPTKSHLQLTSNATPQRPSIQIYESMNRKPFLFKHHRNDGTQVGQQDAVVFIWYRKAETGPARCSVGKGTCP